MKLTKILAMLLALCMILCCFAACDSSDADDDDDDEKVEEKDKDKDKDKDEDDADKLPGKWDMVFDFSSAIAESELGEKYGGDTALTPLSFVLEWEFEEDGDYSVTAIEFPTKKEAARFYEILMYSMTAELSADEIDAVLSDSGYDDLEEYIEDSAEIVAESFVESMRDNAELYEGEYAVDGDVITLDDEVEITYNIYKEEMTFEKIKDEDGDLSIFESHSLQRQ